jgi:hypothetical protein
MSPAAHLIVRLPSWVLTQMATPKFDFITTREFRESLEADYAEMNKCADAKAWKSVQVLAGSIVEALLVDYLANTSHPSRAGKDPLKFDLATAIATCRSEEVLSPRAADLCSVVRSYRNLIHPGRAIRLGEQPPDQSSATIALALIDLIADELASVRRAASGLTAEQILSKIQRDSSAIGILKHLLTEVSEQQRERLLLELLPGAYLGTTEQNDPFDNTRERLSRAFRVTLESSSEFIKRKVASEFVRILREEDGYQVSMYGEALFKPEDIKHVSPQHQDMIREHLLDRVGSIHSQGTLALLEGIDRYLTPKDAVKWLDPFIRTLVSGGLQESLKSRARKHLLDAVQLTPGE